MIEVPQRVKDALKKGTYKKNWRMIVLEEDGSEAFTIDNNNLIKDSIKLDERMCSGDELKFGLCEGSSLEFQFFGHPNIKGRKIRAMLDIQYKEADGSLAWYAMPMGFFDVDQCPRQFDTGIMKVTAFNKLRSKYLDEKANATLLSKFDSSSVEITFGDIREILLKEYEMTEPKYNILTPTRAKGDVGNNRKFGANGSVVFKEKYGIDSPLNYFEYAGADSVSTTVYTFCASISSYADLEPNKAYKVKFNYDIRELEQSYFDEVKRLFDLSMNVDIDAFMDNLFKPNTSQGTYYDKYDGWHNFFGISVEKANGDVENYSTLAFERKAKGIKGSIIDLEKITLTDCTKIVFTIPRYIRLDQSSSSDGSHWSRLDFYGLHNYRYFASSSLSIASLISSSWEWLDPKGDSTSYNWALSGWYELREYENISEADKITVKINELPDITLREATSASYELSAKFGQLDRETDLFSGVYLNNERLFPSDTLYPRDDLFPTSSAERANASIYEKLWTDEGSQKKFKDLIITYKGINDNGEAVDKTLQRQVNADGNVNYNMSDNWLFRNLLWSSESVGAYADAMVEKMRAISWIPFEMWSVGLPYLETGDELEIKTKEGTALSYILTRQLTGIHDLMDTYTNGELDIF